MPTPHSVVELLFTVRGFAQISDEIGKSLVASLNLSIGQWRILRVAGRTPQPLTVPQIARRLRLTRQAVQRAADDLVERGLLSFENNQDHMSSPILILTASGSVTFAEVQRREHSLGLCLHDELSDADHKVMSDAIVRLAEAMRRIDADKLFEGRPGG
jgi:DNA-binding MarR family transcriptional regulator